MVVSFSTTAQVRTTLNDSPILTAPALVRHQQRMGSASTVSVGGAPDEFCGRWVVDCAPSETPTATTPPRLIHPLFMSASPIPSSAFVPSRTQSAQSHSEPDRDPAEVHRDRGLVPSVRP